MNELTIVAPAKVNLFLEVGDLGEDGLHEVCLVNQSIDLCDRLTIRPASQAGHRLEITGPESSTLSGLPDQDNTVFRALRELEIQSRRLPRVSVTIEKNIPIGSGLGGASADAAAVLKGMTRMLSLSLTEQDLVDIGSRVGSDVPFALAGGIRLVEGKGEKTTPLDFPLEDVRYVLASPPISVSTAWAYQALDQFPERPRRDPAPFLHALEKQDYGLLAASVWNAFEPVVFAQHPELAGMVVALEEGGCDAAWLTGSGSNVVGLCRNSDQAAEAVRAVSPFCPARTVKPWQPPEALT